MKQLGSRRPRGNLSLWLDVSMFLLTCVLMAVSLTGLPLHEWLGIALGPLLLLHLNWNAQWFIDQFRRLMTSGNSRARINFFLNASLLAMMAALLVSGILVSHQLAALVRDGMGRRQVWHNIHNWSSVVVLVLVSLHLGLNWDWILAAFRRRPREMPAPVEVPVSNGTSSTIRGAVNVNFFTKNLAIASVAVIAAFAVYLPTAVMTPPPAVSTPTTVQQNPGVQSTGNSVKHGAKSRRPPTRRGIFLLVSTFLGSLVLAVVSRYALRLRL